MHNKKTLVNPEKLYRAVDDPRAHGSTMKEMDHGSIDDYVNEVFKVISEDAKQKYAAEGISVEEQKKLFRFCTCLALEGHEGQERDNGKPYAVHPLGTTYFGAQFGPSSFALDSFLEHDLGEEWMKALGKDPNDKDYRFVKAAAMTAPGILAYKYVMSNFPQPERFFRHIAMIQMAYNSLTRWPDETYFFNLYDAFYRQSKNSGIRKASLVYGERNRKVLSYHLARYFGIDSPHLVREFGRDIIIGYNPSREMWKKIRRRSIMGKIADGYDNSSDLLELQISKALKTLAKEICVINQVTIMESMMRKPESLDEFSRVMAENDELKNVLFQDTSVIGHLVRRMKKEGKVTDDYQKTIDDEIEIFNEFVSVMLGYKENMVDDNDLNNQFRYLMVFQDVGKNFLAERGFHIEKFDLRQLRKEQMARNHKTNYNAVKA